MTGCIAFVHPSIRMPYRPYVRMSVASSVLARSLSWLLACLAACLLHICAKSISTRKSGMRSELVLVPAAVPVPVTAINMGNNAFKTTRLILPGIDREPEASATSRLSSSSDALRWTATLSLLLLLRCVCVCACALLLGLEEYSICGVGASMLCKTCSLTGAAVAADLAPAFESTVQKPCKSKLTQGG